MRKIGKKGKMSKKRKSSDEELVTVKVKQRVKNSILEIQALLQLKEHKHFSHSDIVEYALTCVPELRMQLPPSVKIYQGEERSGIRIKNRLRQKL